MMGATEVLALTCAAVIEEGFPRADLERIQASIRETCREAGAAIVTGDTKVMGRGEIDGIVLNTTGLGLTERVVPDSGLAAGDRILVTGTMGDHGLAIMAARHALELEGALASDVAPINGLIRAALSAADGAIVAMKDPTRGGLSSALHEMAEKSRVGHPARGARRPGHLRRARGGRPARDRSAPRRQRGQGGPRGSPGGGRARARGAPRASPREATPPSSAPASPSGPARSSWTPGSDGASSPSPKASPCPAYADAPPARRRPLFPALPGAREPPRRPPPPGVGPRRLPRLRRRPSGAAETRGRPASPCATTRSDPSTPAGRSPISLCGASTTAESSSASTPGGRTWCCSSSYLYLLTAPMLEAFPGRIVNVHGSDLARTGRDGRPLYAGLTRRSRRDPGGRAGDARDRPRRHRKTR